MSNRPEAQRVEAKLGARAHRKDIANNSADARGRSLKWLDRAGMIVTFDFECDCPTVTNIDDAGVFFARSDQNVRTARREFFELFTGVFVRAVLAPHHGKNSELGEIRFAPENLFDPLKLFWSQTMFGYEIGGDRRIDDGFRRDHDA